jgi:hypothetical protein
MKATGVVMIADGIPDGSGMIHPLGSVGVPDIRVAVTLGYNPAAQIGTATLWVVEDKIYGVFDLFESFCGFPPMTPAIKGIVESRDGDIIWKSSILSVGLFHDCANVDPRIEPIVLGE